MNHHIKKSDSCNVHTDSFEVFMGAEIQVKVLWVVTLCNVNTIQCHNPAEPQLESHTESCKCKLQHSLHFHIGSVYQLVLEQTHSHGENTF